MVGDKGREARTSSDRDGRIYHLAVPVLKSTQNSVILRRSCPGTAKKLYKNRVCCFAHKTYCVLDVSVAVVVAFVVYRITVFIRLTALGAY